jgi:mannose-1-phosphate guanylyltransferase
MIQQTVSRLRPLGSSKNVWVITNQHLRREIMRQLPRLSPGQVLAEPVGRNTAPAIGLAAFILLNHDPTAILGLFPSDHVIGDEERFRAVIRSAVEIAASGENIVVLGIRPTCAETGYGYIEAGSPFQTDALHVRRFAEKPDAARAAEFLKAGNYFWNSGMFLWGARTLANALLEHLPKTAPRLQQIAATFGTRKFAGTFDRLYPGCENISIDYAVLEPRSAKGEHSSNLFCLRADFGWNDLGSWAALYEHHSTAMSNANGGNVVESGDSYLSNATGNYIYAPDKFVAAVGVNNLVVVETEDAILVTTREHSQDVGKIVKYLNDKKRTDLV